MLVNNIDVSTYHAKLMSKDIQSATVTIFDDWLRKARNPLYLGMQETFKAIKMQFVIEDTTDDACLTDISNLMTQLKRCTVKFDDRDLYYDCTLASTDHGRLVQPGYFVVNVELKSGYAYGAEITETMTQVLTKTITVLGNLPSPAKVTITPSINMGSLTITGFEHDITIATLLQNVPVVIDGELGTILQNGSNKFADATLWEFPVLQPGSNVIGASSSNCTITIKYKPKYI